MFPPCLNFIGSALIVLKLNAPPTILIYPTCEPALLLTTLIPLSKLLSCESFTCSFVAGEVTPIPTFPLDCFKTNWPEFPLVNNVRLLSVVVLMLFWSNLNVCEPAVKSISASPEEGSMSSEASGEVVPIPTFPFPPFKYNILSVPLLPNVLNLIFLTLAKVVLCVAEIIKSFSAESSVICKAWFESLPILALPKTSKSVVGVPPIPTFPPNGAKTIGMSDCATAFEVA